MAPLFVTRPSTIVLAGSGMKPRRISSRPFRLSRSWQTLIELEPMSTPTRLFPSAISHGSVAPGPIRSQKSALHESLEVVLRYRERPMSRWLQRQKWGGPGVALALAFVVSSGRADPPRETNHVVERGDTLGALARQYKVSIESLRAANGLERKQRIKAGQTLVIPAPDAAPSVTPEASARWVRQSMHTGVVRLIRG